MKMGTRSLLFGAHQFLLHPLLVFIAWWRLFGFPADPRLWLVFVIHDWGYWGKPNMDGPEGETHVEWAANACLALFGPDWRDLCLYHSRFYAKRDGRPFSRLCVADKLVIVMEPSWLYLPRVWLTGEVWEYMQVARGRSEGKYRNMQTDTDHGLREWHRSMKTYVKAWVAQHRDMREDTWTPAPKAH